MSEYLFPITFRDFWCNRAISSMFQFWIFRLIMKWISIHYDISIHMIWLISDFITEFKKFETNGTSKYAEKLIPKSKHSFKSFNLKVISTCNSNILRHHKNSREPEFLVHSSIISKHFSHKDLHQVFLLETDNKLVTSRPQSQYSIYRMLTK